MLDLLLLAACHRAPSPTPDKTTPPAPISPTVPTTTTPTTTTPTTPLPTLPDGAREAIAEAIQDDLDQSNATGASVAIWLDGAIVYAEGFGTRDPETGDPVTPDTRFAIGSDTKKITALAVLQAVGRGELSLDAPLSDCLPDLTFASDPTLTDRLTLRQLLSHQSLLFDYTNWMDEPDDDDLAEEIYGTFAEGAFVMAPPGAFFDYANPNYALAALCLEDATGRYWADIVTADLFGPLQLAGTVARKADLPPGAWATGVGYVQTALSPDPFDPFASGSFSFGTIPHDEEADNAFMRPAGLAWSTAADMARLAAFLVDGDPAILADELRETLTTSQVSLFPSLSGLDYGFGMILQPTLTLDDAVYATPLWYHGGNTLDMTSTLYVLPESRFAVAILSNGYGDDFTATAGAALSTVPALPATSTPYEAPPIDPQIFVGAWYDPHSLGQLAITEDEASGTLRAALPDLDARGIAHAQVLQPVAPGVALLSLGGVARELTFVEGATPGEVRWVRDRAFVAASSPSTFAEARSQEPPHSPSPASHLPRTPPPTPLRFASGRRIRQEIP